MLKNILLFITIFFSILGASFFILMRYWPALFGSSQLWDEYQIEKRIVDGKELRLVVADTPKRWSHGLMFVKVKSPDYDGMIFKFPSASARMFWNMNTYVDLKIYWLQGEKIIGTTKLPSIKKSKTIVTRSSPGPADIVIEVIQ